MPQHRERNIAMTSREAAIYQLKKLKGQPFKKKISYILTYFWVPITAVVAAVVFLVSMCIHWASLKPSALTICCINSAAEQENIDGYLQGFAQAQGIDTEQYQLTARIDITFFGKDMEINYQNAQALFALMVTGGLDVMAADHDTIVRYSYQQAFIDMEELLTQEQMDILAPHLLYMDLGYLDEMDTVSDETRQYPDPTKPEDMEQPVPIAITLQPGWEFAKTAYPYTYGEDAVALIAGADNSDNAAAFLQYVLDQEGN